MQLLDYFKKHGPDSRMRVAVATGTHIQQIQNIAYGYRRPNIHLAIKINAATQGQVRLESLRPDIDWVQLRDDLIKAA